jgi:polyhydroxybutyrate depolymerase
MASRRALIDARDVSPLHRALRRALAPRLPTTPPLTLAAAATCLSLAACGDDTSGTGGGGGASSTTDAATTSSTTVAATTAASSGSGTGGDGSGGSGGGTPFDDRPFEVFVPSSYEEGTPMPLVVLLHGYTISGQIQEAYMAIEPLAEELGFLYVVPDGTEEDSAAANRFWNATDACCNFYGSTVDDSGYLRHIVDSTSAAYSVDPKRVHFMGHSNGGFMSYRMACEHADAIASIVSLAGATFADPADCAPSEPVAILQIHGTADATISYEGGTFGGSYPGAVETAEIWAAYDGCGETPTAGEDRDLDDGEGKEGDESTTLQWSDGCDPGGLAELWTIPEGAHAPSLSDTFSRQAIEWLLDHPKP